MKKIATVFFLIYSVIFGRIAYEIEKLDIVANIQADGSINILEQVLFNIDEVNGIFYNIDTLGFGQLKNLEIYYEDKFDDNFKKAINSTYLERGNYTVAERDGFYKIKLYAPARNEQKEFIFKYTLTNGITAYRDIAQLNRKMIGKAWDEPIKYVNIVINLPKSVPKNQIYAFGHGPLHGIIDIESEKKIVYSIKNYYPGNFLEINLLFPLEVVNKIDTNRIIDKDGLSQILEVEKKLAIKANFIREAAIKQVKIEKIIFGMGVLLWLIVVIYVYVKNSKKYKIENEYRESYSELPDNYSPAIVGTLIDRKSYPETKELFATILDLIRRDYLKLTEVNGKTILEYTNKNINSLKDYEKFLFKWYIDELGDGKKIILEDLTVFTTNNIKQYSSNFERWQIMVYTDMLYNDLRNDKADTFSCCVGIISGFGFFISGMLLSEYFSNNIFFIWIILGLFLFPYTVSRKRYNLEKEKAYSRWKEFKKFLSNPNNLNENDSVSQQIWERDFVYAVTLGVTEKFANKYEKILSQRAYFSFVNYDISLIEIYLYHDIIKKLNLSTKIITKNSFYNMDKSSFFND